MNPVAGAGQRWEPDLVSASRPHTWNRVLCPGEGQPSGHLRLQEGGHLERLEPPGRRLHAQQGCVSFTISSFQENVKMSGELYILSPSYLKSQRCSLLDPVAFRRLLSDVQTS